MKLFLDTANLEAVEHIAAWGVLDGVTTNPSLLAKEGKIDPEKQIKALSRLVNGPVNMEVIGASAKEMVEEGKRYARWAENVVVKIPMTEEGLKAVNKLSSMSIPTNVTLIFSANQALLAAKAGARYVSPFIGRLDEHGEDGLALVSEIVDIFRNYELSTEVLVASIRHPRHVTEAARMGADICTLPPEIFEKLLHHPLTDLGLAKFLADWKKLSKGL